MVTKKNLLLCALSVCLLSPLFSQSDSLSTKGGFGFSVQWQRLMIELDGLNSNLADIGYPGLEPGLNELCIALERRKERGVFSLGFSFALLDEDEGGVTGRETRYRHWQLAARTTYDLVKSERWVLGPVWASYFQYARFSLSEDSPNSSFNSLNQLLNTEVKSASRFELPIELGLGVRHYFRFSPSSDWLFLGLEGGYRLNLNSADWLVEGASSLRGNLVPAKGFYFQLNFGVSQ